MNRRLLLHVDLQALKMRTTHPELTERESRDKVVRAMFGLRRYNEFLVALEIVEHRQGCEGYLPYKPKSAPADLESTPMYQLMGLPKKLVDSALNFGLGLFDSDVDPAQPMWPMGEIVSRTRMGIHFDDFLQEGEFQATEPWDIDPCYSDISSDEVRLIEERLLLEEKQRAKKPSDWWEGFSDINGVA